MMELVFGGLVALVIFAITVIVIVVKDPEVAKAGIDALSRLLRG